MKKKKVKKKKFKDLPPKMKIVIYNKLIEENYGGEGCWICGTGRKTRRLHIDHNHKTEKIRGLLCHRCNRGLACFRDNPERLRNAAVYLEKSQ